MPSQLWLNPSPTKIDPVQARNAGIECETLIAQNRLSGIFSFHVSLRRQEAEVRARDLNISQTHS